MWSAGGYREGVLSRKITGSTSATKLQEGEFMNTQVSILLNPSDLDERIREGMAMSSPRFVLDTAKDM